MELIQAPETYDRPSGRQYWAKVRMIPRVYIQHDGMAEPDLEELRRSLARLGFDVPQPELTPDAAGKNELRFFGADGKTLAIRLLDSVEAGRVAGLPALACHDFSDYMKDRKKYDIPLGQIELWIGRDVVTRGRTPSVGCT